MKQLSEKYQRSIPWVRKQIFEYEPPYHTYNPREITVVADATFFGKKRDKFGVLVFKDAISNEILIWKHIETEQIKDYKYLISELLERDFTIQHKPGSRISLIYGIKSMKNLSTKKASILQQVKNNIHIAASKV